MTTYNIKVSSNGRIGYEETRTEKGHSMLEVIARVLAMRKSTKDPDYIEVKVLAKDYCDV